MARCGDGLEVGDDLMAAAARASLQALAGLTPADQALASTGLQLGMAWDEHADEHETGDFLVRSIRAEGVGGFFAAGEFGPLGGRNHRPGFTASILCFP